MAERTCDHCQHDHTCTAEIGQIWLCATCKRGRTCHGN